MTEKQKIGKFFKDKRETLPSYDYKKENISQQELADKIGEISKNTILSIENGNGNPTLDNLLILSHALGCKKLNLFDIEIDVEKYIKEKNLK